MKRLISLLKSLLPIRFKLLPPKTRKPLTTNVLLLPKPRLSYCSSHACFHHQAIASGREFDPVCSSAADTFFKSYKSEDQELESTFAKYFLAGYKSNPAPASHHVLLLQGLLLLPSRTLRAIKSRRLSLPLLTPLFPPMMTVWTLSVVHLLKHTLMLT